jgi:hypothetical protein
VSCSRLLEVLCSAHTHAHGHNLNSEDSHPLTVSGFCLQGGIFVFRGKELMYSWRDEATGDHAPMDDVLSACLKVPVA